MTMLRSTIDLTMTYGRGDSGENMAYHRRNLVDPGTCEVPKNQTITLEEWQAQQT